MKKLFVLVLFLLASCVANSQTVSDLFNSSEFKVSWLGIDFSHVKLIGDFSQICGIDSKDEEQIRDVYFPGWNNLVLDEPKKYDIKRMLRLSDIYNDIEMITQINSGVSPDDLFANSCPVYSQSDIEKFISSYKIERGEGIGVLLVAERLNKTLKEAYFHFVAINMATKEILIYERIRGRPKGGGLRNYWAGAIYSIMKDIRINYYYVWKRRSHLN